MSQLKFSFPSPKRFKRLGTVLTKKERFFLYLATFILFISLIGWAVNFYVSSTEKLPTFGGELSEGMVGQPHYINPVLSHANEIDYTLCNLIFSSLLTYDKEAKLVNDLAESYEILEDGKKYKLKIKQGVKWHDKTELTAKDVVFTTELIKKKGVQLKSDWEKVTVRAEDDYTVIFQLEEPYAPFLNRLTFGILPKHVFEGVDNFLLTTFNIEPVGSGPYEFSKIEKDSEDKITSYQLLANPEYYGDKPFLEKINFNFYDEEDALFDAYKRKEINAFGVLSNKRANELAQRRDTRLHVFQISRYFAVFLNQTKSVSLSNTLIRQALIHATNRQELIQAVFDGYATPVETPLLPSFGEFSSSPDVTKHAFDPARAEEILENAGWKKDEDGIRKKDGEVLEVSLVTTEWPVLNETAEVLKKQWERVGVRLSISKLERNNFQQNFVKTREYQSILFGQEYRGNDPDPYLFWHSKWKKDSGLNIAVYDNAKVDKLLEEAQISQDINERKTKYAEFEKIVTEDLPAVFLYSPSYIYITNVKIKGVETTSLIHPSYRVNNASNWFIKSTRRKK